MKTYILISSVSDTDRSDLEGIENNFYERFEDLKKDLEEKEISVEWISNLSDFVDACNDEAITIDNNWITYVNVAN